ncbi:hypothetical protein ACT7DZ_35335 [Bacillus cereus]
MKKIVVMAMIIVGALSSSVFQTDIALSKNKSIEQVQRFAADPGTG